MISLETMVRFYRDLNRLCVTIIAMQEEIKKGVLSQEDQEEVHRQILDLQRLGEAIAVFSKDEPQIPDNVIRLLRKEPA